MVLRVTFMKKVILSIILIGAFLSYLLPGETRGDEKLSFSCLAFFMEEGGAQIDGLELEGWACLKKEGSLDETWRGLNLQKFLGIKRGTPAIWMTEHGEAMSYKSVLAQGTELEVVLQKFNHLSDIGNPSYLLVKVNIPVWNQAALDWERRLRKFLASLGKEHGLYLTIRGRIPKRLETGAQETWAKAIFETAGGEVASSLKTERFISLVGYTPTFSDWVWAGKKKVNLNVALTNSTNLEETFVYLGTPLISSEY